MFENIENYYEQLVTHRIMDAIKHGEIKNEDENLLEDIACVALNQLPARYVRHRVDLVFYMPMNERVEVTEAVDKAVKTAIAYVTEHHTEYRPTTFTAEQ